MVIVLILLLLCVNIASQAEWTQPRGIENFDLLKVMSSESELLTWKSQGLSADRLSQENAVMIKYGCMVPFIVDPNSQAIEWLKQLAQNSEVVLSQDPKLASQLELAVRFGKVQGQVVPPKGEGKLLLESDKRFPVQRFEATVSQSTLPSPLLQVLIIQEVDGIENFLFSLLRRDFLRQGPRQVVQVGDKMCDFNENFRLYLCTRNSNAIDSLPPNASCLVTRVNFSVTRAGLEGQLLGETLGKFASQEFLMCFCAGFLRGFVVSAKQYCLVILQGENDSLRKSPQNSHRNSIAETPKIRSAR